MGTFQAVYSDAQRDAVAEAYVDRKLGTAAYVAQLAGEGKLPHGDELLEPFEVSPQYVLDRARYLRKRRRGLTQTGVAAVALARPRDAVAMVAARLASMADKEAERLERKQRRGALSAKDLETVRQIARALRELAALPGQDEARPPKPGHGPKEERSGGTTGGLAASILEEHRSEKVRSRNTPPNTQDSTGEDADSSAAENASADSTDTESSGEEDGERRAVLREHVLGVGVAGRIASQLSPAATRDV